MTDRSQFILITHIKRTMQTVDVLYGVTMGSPASRSSSASSSAASGARRATARAGMREAFAVA